MRKLLCPQCKVGVFCVKDSQGNRLPVYVTDRGEVVSKDASVPLDGFDLEVVYCLGCSWSGSPKRLVRY